jgi:hypothetical protein
MPRCLACGLRIPIAPQVRAINRNLIRRFPHCTAAKNGSARTSAIARLFGFGLRAEHLAGPHCCCLRLSGRVASRNAMTLVNVASRGPRKTCSGDTRQLAYLSVYLPPVQRVSCSAHGAAGSALRQRCSPGGRSGQARAQALGPWRTRRRYERLLVQPFPGRRGRRAALPLIRARGCCRPSCPISPAGDR